MTITEPLELAASWLQVQLEVANHTAALDLEGLDATGKALVLQGWSLLTSAAKPGSQDSHGFQLPIWACILGLILILAMMFYLVNFMLWARREKAQRVHDLEDAKMHSEHGNLLGGLIEAAIERFDESLFGVNVDFGAMKVTVSEGVVVIHDLTIENPAGYWSTHFLHIGELLIDLDLQSFITSMGKEVVIQRLELRDVEVIWEGGLVSSNMRDILKCMSGPKDDSNQSDKNRQKEGGER